MNTNQQSFKTQDWLPFLQLARAHSLTGFALLLIPALWGCMAAYKLENASTHHVIWYVILLTFGAFVARSAGCVINDIVDHNLDSKVERTKSRPIPTGMVTIASAFKFLALLFSFCLVVLLLLPYKAIIVGIVSVPLIVLYPFAKRFMVVPQLMLAVTFNLGVFVGWFTLSQTLVSTPVMLYLAAALWCLGYDSIYSLQDRQDDIKANNNSAAVYFGDKIIDFVWSAYKLAFVCLGFTGLNAGFGAFFYLIILMLFICIYNQVEQLHQSYNTPDIQKVASKHFSINVLIGFGVVLAIAMG